jgi:hypothetical protein
MKHYLRNAILLAITLMLTVLGSQAQTTVVAGWTFGEVTGAETPFADLGNSNNVGIQQITLSNAAITGYVTGSPGRAITSNGWNNPAPERFWKVSINTLGFENLSLSSKQQSSGTGPRDFKAQYSLDGSTWTDIPDATIIVANNLTSGVLNMVSLPAEASNKSEIFIRWINTSRASVNIGGTTASTGTNRIDEIFIEGTSLGVTLEPTATPTINPIGGTFDEVQLVTLSSETDGAAIYYTLNGSTPNLGSTLYTAPFLIEESTELKAVAIAEGFSISEVATASFTINLPVSNVAGIPYTQNFSLFSALSSPVTTFGANGEWALASSGNVSNYIGLFGTSTTGGYRGGNVLGYQHTGTSGILTATLTLENNTGEIISELEISYLGRVSTINSTQTRFPAWTVSVNGTVYPELAYSTAGGVDSERSLRVGGLNILPEEKIIISWTSDRGLTTGGSRQIGLTDVSVALPVSGGPKIEVSPASLDFGAVSMVAGAPDLSYTISAENLTGHVTATATAPYSISKDGVTFSSSVEFTIAELSSAKQVFVRFANSAVGNFNGTITNSTAGALPASVAVTGSVFDPFNISENFNATCPALPGGWQAISVEGPQVWACTTFGRTGSGLQINGFSGGAVLNEDWLISSSYDLTGFNFPLMTFWSRVAFQGPRLKLLISTNYVNGDPNTATWTELSDRFASGDVWTFSGQVDLSAYLNQTVRIAFVYNSSPESGAARWTLDDFALFNSNVPAAPFLTNSIGNVDYWHFGIVPVGGVSSQSRTFNFNLSNPIADLTITAGEGFEFSKDGDSFNPTLTYEVAELTGVKTVTVRFAPTSEGAFAAPIRLTSGDISVSRGYLTGATINKDETFDVVNWNIEWFGSTNSGQGPTNVNLQLQNVKTIIEDLDADVYAFQEITSLSKFRELAAALPAYGMAVSPAVSAGGTFAEEAQKLTYLFKLATVDTIQTKVLLKGVTPGSLVNYPSSPDRFWASGRLPYLMEIRTKINGVQEKITLVNVHTRSNGGGESAANPRYAMRKYDVNVLKDSLDAYYKDVNLIILGDYNDDLDETVADQTAVTVNTSETSFINYINDSENYIPITISLSNAGLRTFPSFENVIDHQIISNELLDNWIVNSERIVAPYDLIPNYNTTTSDHLAIETRFILRCDLEQATVLASETLVCAGSNSVEFELLGGRFDSIVGWEISTDGGASWTLIEDTADLASITLEDLESASMVRAIIDSEICDPISTEALAIAIKILPTPVIGFERSRLFTLEGPYTYQWYKNGVLVATTLVNDIRIQGAGNYTVMITDEQGCTAVSEEFTFPSKGNSNKVRIFPNPSSNLVHVELKKIEGLQNVELRTSNGILIQSLLTEGGMVQFNVSTLAKGIYLIYVTDRFGAISVERLVVR